MKRYDLELTATGPVMEERQDGAFVPFSEVSGLVDTVMKMGGRCQLLADLLREVTQIVPAIGVAPDDLPAVDAFLERIEAALAGQVLECIGSNALAMMMDELHDICVGLDAPGGAQNGAEAWDRVKGARDRVLASLHQGRPDTEWTDATTSPVSADNRELQEQHDQLQSTHKGTLVLLHEAHEVMRRVIPSLPQDCAKRGDLLDRIEVALAGQAIGRTITEGQELELTTVLQSIANGFSDDPAHDAAALLKRIAGEVPWTGDTFQLLSRQADLPCNQPPSLTGQVFAGLSAATALSGLDASSAADVAQLMLEAAEAKGGEPCATESPSSSPD
ncbi:hypothetical protein [Aeromonas hydrophila]|uniref:hypothetical protein n=1 Tax=Aeromonas hydrophila TaxID=644 RepID=UPI00164F346F|nr:hypothetical protein [Aeromonas hydrophila]MBC6485919.1 hypothetical protein [Aeromonas hydrophila]